MTDAVWGADSGATSGPPRGTADGSPSDRRFEVRDKRRIDPATGGLREAPQPGSSAANPGDPANAVQPVGATVFGGAEELAAAKQQAAERTADLQRITAEYANYRKRVERDKQHATATGKATVVAELLTVLDDLERAAAHGDLTGGFKIVADKFADALARLGLEHYGAVGDEFDPTVHEAVQFATSPDVAHHTVTTVLRSGYHFGERVLRPAVVAVTGPEQEAPQPAADDASGATSVAFGDPGTAGDQVGDDSGAAGGRGSEAGTG